MMSVPEQYRIAEDLERHLGDPRDPSCRFSFERVVELDEAEQYPEELVQVLAEWGFARFHVPPAYGGALTRFEQLLALARVVARRDLAVSVASGVNLLGSMPVWLQGSEEQRRRVAGYLLSNKKLGYAVTEKEHGHDLLANQLKAERSGDRLLLTGEKWTWGNATRAAAFTLFARTEPQGGPRGFSMLLVERAELDPNTYANSQKVRTLGMRGHDLAGIRFHESPVPVDSIVGAPGNGLELANKGLQLTRTLCGGIAMGAADTALRSVMDFALNRILYGAPLFEMDHARSVLVDAFVDLLIADALTTSTVRAFHEITDQMSLWSSVVKYMVPTAMESLVRNVSVILGARFYMRDAHWNGVYAKILRDLPIVSVFEGNTTSQLHSIGIHLPRLLKDRPPHPELATRLGRIFDLGAPLAEYINPSLIDLHSHGENDALQGLPQALVQLRSLRSQMDGPLLQALEGLAVTLSARVHDLSAAVAAARPVSDKAASWFERVRQYATLHAAACCLHLWLHNRERLDPFFARGEWLVLALEKLLHDRSPARGQSDPTYVTAMADRLVELYQTNRLFAIVPFQLGGTH